MKSTIKKLIPSSLKRLYHFGWALLSIARYGRPSKKLKVIGVTGTDGKSTTTTLIHAGLKEAGYKVAMINGLVFSLPNKEWPNKSDNSTPGKFAIRSFLTQAVQEQCDVVILEITSWGLEQYRVFGIVFDVAVITNFAHEHLDLHGSMERYREMKGKLFEYLQSARKPDQPKVSVINVDDEEAEYFLRFQSDQIITYSQEKGANLQATQIEQRPDLSFQLNRDGELYPVEMKLKGQFNVSNTLAAIGACLAVGADVKKVIAGVQSVEQVPGRMEFIDYGQPFSVIVDFAHTAQGFEAMFASARKMIEPGKKIIAVYGSAGGRDPGRRKMIGELAGEMINFSVLTVDDPRNEDPKAIADEIISALQSKGKKEEQDYVFIKDRAEAIAKGIQMAQEGDVVMSLSMGDYDVMYVGDGKVSWSDRGAAQAALEKLGYHP